MARLRAGWSLFFVGVFFFEFLVGVIFFVPGPCRPCTTARLRAGWSRCHTQGTPSRPGRRPRFGAATETRARTAQGAPPSSPQCQRCCWPVGIQYLIEYLIKYLMKV